ncbi:MAG: transposase, partial [Bacteroidota bacterium]
HLSRIFDLVTSVKGVGLIIALNMMVHSNCFKAFDSSRQFACYIGIAPFHKQSGSSLNISAKVSHLGQKKLKALITNGVMSAIQYDKELKAYYHRKVSQGKIKYKVINAVKNKLVHRVFAVVQRGTPYVEIRNYA